LTRVDQRQTDAAAESTPHARRSASLVAVGLLLAAVLASVVAPGGAR